MITAVALCALGAERVLSNELRKMNLSVLEAVHGKVRFTAELEGIYTALIGLRTADRILLETARYKATDFDALYDGAAAIAWEELIPESMSIRVSKIRTNRSRLSATTSIQAVVHKAAAERLCKAWKLPRLSELNDKADIRVYIEKDEALILLDLCGDPLFKRGYRSEGGAAPLRETTAASMILLSMWKRKFPLYDPFCGSGTIPIEAALYAWDAAPGLGRSFVLSQLLIGNAGIEEQVRSALRKRVDFSRRIRIYGSDSSVRAISMARSNALRAYELVQGLNTTRGIRVDTVPEEVRAALPRFEVMNMNTASAPDTEGYILCNPPYGERLGDREEAEQTYQNMEALTEHFKDWKMAVITMHQGFESHFGYAADSVKEITNGALSSYLYVYEKLSKR